MFHHLFGSAGRTSPEELNRDRGTVADLLVGLRRIQEETMRNQSALFRHQEAQDQVLKNIVDQQAGCEQILQNLVHQQNRMFSASKEEQRVREQETRTLRSDLDKLKLEVDKIGRIGRRQSGGGRNERVVPDGVPLTCYYVARSPDGRANCPAGCGSNYSRGYLYKHLQSCGSREGNGPVRILSKPVNIPDGDGNGVPDIAGI